jgi:hypothetical protein
VDEEAGSKHIRHRHTHSKPERHCPLTPNTVNIVGAIPNEMFGPSFCSRTSMTEIRVKQSCERGEREGDRVSAQTGMKREGKDNSTHSTWPYAP